MWFIKWDRIIKDFWHKKHVWRKPRPCARRTGPGSYSQSQGFASVPPPVPCPLYSVAYRRKGEAGRWRGQSLLSQSSSNSLHLKSLGTSLHRWNGPSSPGASPCPIIVINHCHIVVLQINVVSFSGSLEKTLFLILIVFFSFFSCG